MKTKHSFDVYQLTTLHDVVKYDLNHNKTYNGKQLCERPRIAINDYTQTESNEFAFLSGCDFRSIFGDKNANYGSKLAVVKITNAQTGKSIHRLFRTSHDVHNLSSYIVLSYSSLLNLCKDQATFDCMDKLVVSEGCVLKYYINHPNHCTKIMLWMAIASTLLSIVSILVSIL